MSRKMANLKALLRQLTFSKPYLEKSQKKVRLPQSFLMTMATEKWCHQRPPCSPHHPMVTPHGPPRLAQLILRRRELIYVSLSISLSGRLLALCGMHDAEAKPVLLCSSIDNSIRVYDLPSFSERGNIYSKEEVRSIQIGSGGLFFTGDGTGEVRVWKWLA